MVVTPLRYSAGIAKYEQSQKDQSLPVRPCFPGRRFVGKGKGKCDAHGSLDRGPVLRTGVVLGTRFRVKLLLLCEIVG